MTSKQRMTFAIAVFALFFSTQVFAHAPGVNPSRTDDSPSGRNPGSGVERGEWQSGVQKDLDRVNNLIEQTKNEMADLQEKGKSAWDKSVALTVRIEHLQRENTQSVEDIESAIQGLSEMIDLLNANNPQIKKTKPWDDAAKKVAVLSPEAAESFTKDIIMPEMLEAIRYELGYSLNEAKVIKEELEKAYAERAKTQSDYGTSSLLAQELRKKMEDFNTSANYYNSLLENTLINYSKVQDDYMIQRTADHSPSASAQASAVASSAAQSIADRAASASSNSTVGPA